MKIITQALLLIALNFASHSAKQFEECEFARELYERHLVPVEDIYKHFCIANTLHTAKNNFGFKGVYAIGSQWWCGEDEPGGGCNVKCSDLLDDDIADDVACASLILRQQGVQGWSRNENQCKRSFGSKTEDCIAEFEVLDNLVLAQIQTTSSTPVPSTVSPTTSMTTRTSTAKTTTTERFVRQNNTERSILDEAANQMEVQKCSCAAQNTLLTIIVLALCGATVAIFLKYRNLKRHVSSSNMEYENQLIS